MLLVESERKNAPILNLPPSRTLHHSDTASEESVLSPAPCSIVVAIPTFKRPKSLERLLRMLPLQEERAFRIIVADNDALDAQGAAVCDRLVAEGYGLPLQALTVAERGISNSRNALIAAALADPEVGFIVMIDDDEWPHPQWLAQLLKIQAQEAADVVGGPVYRVFEAPIAPYVASANFAVHCDKSDGQVSIVEACGNVLIRADLFRHRPAPWFDPQFGLSGSEDTDLFERLAAEGVRFAWAATAWATEVMPASRCSPAWALQRANRLARMALVLALRRRPWPSVALEHGTKTTGLIGVALILFLGGFWSAQARFKGRWMLARAAGKLSAFAGYTGSEYHVTHGS